MAPLFAIRDMTISLTRAPADLGGEPAKPEERVVIEGASIAVDQGETVALVGESGSGKSLLAMASVDLLGPSARVVSGTTVFEGHVLQDLDDADWRSLVGMGIGVLLQDAIGSWDPLDFIGSQSGEALLEHTDLTQEEVQQRVLDALGEVGLSKRHYFTAFAHEVSRGQAQRGMLASALLSAPRMLIADEPLSGLDVTVGGAVLDLINDMRAKRGMGMLLVTHDMGVVAAVADRVAVVYAGSIVENGPVVDVYHTPLHPYTSGLLGSLPSLTGDRLRPIEGETPDLFEVEPGCRFADRCPYVIARCWSDKPAPRLLGSTLVACHRADELELKGVG
ncbi:MAG: ABC transporter ATP-binding protein [Acidobacteria bacterium]|nr:ABC transporter ATP-binding protein [Acidobacteriota bacterium]